MVSEKWLGNSPITDQVVQFANMNNLQPGEIVVIGPREGGNTFDILYWADRDLSIKEPQKT